MKKKRAKLKRIRRTIDICAALILLSMLYLIGSAGGLENDALTLTQFAIRAATSFPVIIIAALITKHMAKLEKEILSYQ